MSCCSTVVITDIDQFLVDQFPVKAVLDAVVEDDTPELQVAIYSDSADAAVDRNSSNMIVALFADAADY